MTHTARFKMPSGLNDIDVELPELTCDLPDGRVGVYQRRQDDCLRASIATLLGLSYEEAPDWDCGPDDGKAAELAGWQALEEWARGRGLRLVFHGTLPDDRDYIAIGTGWEDGYRHCAVIVGGQTFEPGSGFRLPAWMRLEPLERADFAITFEGSSE